MGHIRQPYWEKFREFLKLKTKSPNGNDIESQKVAGYRWAQMATNLQKEKKELRSTKGTKVNTVPGWDSKLEAVPQVKEKITETVKESIL